MRNHSIAAVLAVTACTTGGPPRSDISVTMTGVQEAPGPGDPDGTGTVEVRVEPANGRVCWRLFARDIDPATAAHIHRGAAGAAGPPVVTLTTPGPDGRSEGCAAVSSTLARELSREAHEFYVNVHTAAFPAGAIRGQLRGGTISPRRVPEIR